MTENSSEARATLPAKINMAANPVVLNGSKGEPGSSGLPRLSESLATCLGLNVDAQIEGRRYRGDLSTDVRAESIVNTFKTRE